jgi:hypothetical protein
LNEELAAACSEARKFAFSQESILEELSELDNKIDSYKKQSLHISIDAEKE